jgi:hypothetical protein
LTLIFFGLDLDLGFDPDGFWVAQRFSAAVNAFFQLRL